MEETKEFDIETGENNELYQNNTYLEVKDTNFVNYTKSLQKIINFIGFIIIIAFIYLTVISYNHPSLNNTLIESNTNTTCILHWTNKNYTCIIYI
jgi:large-conductance mechanosensitive channel